MPRAFTMADIFNQLNSDIQDSTNESTTPGSIELQTNLAPTIDALSLSDMTSGNAPTLTATASTLTNNWDATTWGNFLWS